VEEFNYLRLSLSLARSLARARARSLSLSLSLSVCYTIRSYNIIHKVYDTKGFRVQGLIKYIRYMTLKDLGFRI
jgi:hypothetical protein